MSLSDKIVIKRYNTKDSFFLIEDVKEFIQKIIKTIQGNYIKSPSKMRILETIKEEAGAELLEAGK